MMRAVAICWPLVGFAALLAGCASAPAKHVPMQGPAPANAAVSAPATPRYNLAGYSAAFKEGFGDACAQRRDEERFKTEVDYQMGWSDGQSLCPRR
jgi:hypothetical protein